MKSVRSAEVPYLIFRPTRRERESRLAESRARSPEQTPVEGVVRRTEEAYELQRQRAREGHEFLRPYAVSGLSPEAQKAEFELMQRAGIKDDLIEEYQAHEVRRERFRAPFAWEKQ